jgi:hypothetical protein
MTPPTPSEAAGRDVPSLSERFQANRCSGWQGGRCVHGFPGTRFCIGSLDPVRMFEAAKPQCCDEEWNRPA